MDFLYLVLFLYSLVIPPPHLSRLDRDVTLHDLTKSTWNVKVTWKYNEQSLFNHQVPDHGFGVYLLVKCTVYVSILDNINRKIFIPV